jgi:hypothetical protein
MKRLPFSILLLVLIISIISCSHNRLKTDEKDLRKELLASEKEPEKDVQAKNSSGSMEYKSGSIRKKEIRSADRQRPPVLIDLPGVKNSTRNFRLSDIASSVTYIKLQSPPDTSLIYDPFFSRKELISIIRSDGENIVLQGIFGISRFNMKGEYMETIWKNETGISIRSGGIGYGGNDFFGVMPNNQISIHNGSIYYSFNDGPEGNGIYLKYKFPTNKALPIQSSTETPGSRMLKGDTLLSTKQQPSKRFESFYGIGEDASAGINHKWNSGKAGSFLVTFNDKGDTLCQFTDYEHIENFTKSVYRRPVDLKSYLYNGLLTIKQEFNDTIFRLIPPDRLMPAYIISFGENKVNYKDGLNPDFDLSGKYLLNSLYETNGFLLIRYTQNHDSPINRKKGTVKFYNVLFDKKQGKVFGEPGFSLMPEDPINDLDGGMPFWPDFVTPQDEMMKLVSGKTIKDYINSEEFKTANISDENRRKQITLASGLRPTDMVIVFVK